jgi:hypothetical protein
LDSIVDHESDSPASEAKPNTQYLTLILPTIVPFDNLARSFIMMFNVAMMAKEIQ